MRAVSVVTSTVPGDRQQRFPRHLGESLPRLAVPFLGRSPPGQPDCQKRHTQKRQRIQHRHERQRRRIPWRHDARGEDHGSQDSQHRACAEHQIGTPESLQRPRQPPVAPLHCCDLRQQGNQRRDQRPDAVGGLIHLPTDFDADDHRHQPEPDDMAATTAQTRARPTEPAAPALRSSCARSHGASFPRCCSRRRRQA